MRIPLSKPHISSEAPRHLLCFVFGFFFAWAPCCAFLGSFFSRAACCASSIRRLDAAAASPTNTVVVASTSAAVSSSLACRASEPPSCPSPTHSRDPVWQRLIHGTSTFILRFWDPPRQTLLLLFTLSSLTTERWKGGVGGKKGEKKVSEQEKTRKEEQARKKTLRTHQKRHTCKASFSDVVS